MLILVYLNSAGTTMVITAKVESPLPILPAAVSTEINSYVEFGTAIMYPYQAENLSEHVCSGDPSYSTIGPARTPQHKGFTPQESIDSAYTHFNSCKVAGKDIWTEWFTHHSTEYLQTPPPNRPGHIQNRTLFVLVNPDIEADIRARRPPEVVGLPPKLTQCLTVWIWKDSLQEWRTIQYGDAEIINGEWMALSLGGISGIEPRWIIFASYLKEDFTRPRRRSC
ncbi:hypothetical protein BDP27DRAFT_1428293 [Rhodocollybia butyracea]|uniref:Uncharacterized protein n=1 Tax=Rhodocollybia butyracea TaxID=206335 RepID=A0A9P5U177_9AGAR|nr:hypothetical protein BDP27DRAFT_1428293 [Rhodocollybia butyracea]